MTIEPQVDQTPEQEQYEDQAPEETRYDEMEAPNQGSYEDQPEVVSREPEAQVPAESQQPEVNASVDESGDLARMVSQLDPVIQRELWSKILSFAQQRIPAETALHLAARAIEDELRKYF